MRRHGVRAAAAARALAALLAAALLSAPAAARASTAVRIEGNAALGERSLREAAAVELAGLDDPARRAAALADAAFEMERAGRAAGHPFIEVEYAISGEGDGAVALFTVREGPMVGLGEVSFSGNAFFEAARLRQYVAVEGSVPYVEADIRDGRKALVQLYRDEGFADVRIDEPRIDMAPDRGVADVSFEIVEGTRFVIRSVALEGDSLPVPAPGLQRMVSGLSGQPWFERRRPSLVSAVTEAFANQGYPDVAVDVSQKPGGQPGEVALRVAVASGPRVRVGRIDVAGNEKTRTKLILSRIPVKPGDWFNQEAVHEGARELYRTGIFLRVDHSLEGEGAERSLKVRVEEAPTREVFGEVGWGSYERLRGSVGVRNRNVFGTGRNATAEAGASTKSRSVETTFLDPRFLGSRFSLSVPLTWRYREEPTYTEEEVELSARLYRIFPGRITAGLKYGFNFDDLSHLSPDVTPDARDEVTTTASVKASVDIDRRDNIFYPKRGWQATLSAEVADQRLGGSMDFLRCTAAGKFFLPLGAGFVLGLRLDSGFIVPTRETEDIPVSDRFFTGGESSVRSFEQDQVGPKGETGDPLGGLASTVASVEIRRRFAGNVAASIFADFGNVAPNRSLAGIDQGTLNTGDYIDAMWADYLQDFRAGVGFGLQYLTPIGPIRLDLAWNPDPRAADGEADFASHFSIGMAF